MNHPTRNKYESWPLLSAFAPELAGLAIPPLCETQPNTWNFYAGALKHVTGTKDSAAPQDEGKPEVS